MDMWSSYLTQEPWTDIAAFSCSFPEFKSFGFIYNKKQVKNNQLDRFFKHNMKPKNLRSKRDHDRIFPCQVLSLKNFGAVLKILFCIHPLIVDDCDYDYDWLWLTHISIEIFEWILSKKLSRQLSGDCKSFREFKFQTKCYLKLIFMCTTLCPWRCCGFVV